MEPAAAIERTTEAARPWIVTLARLGYAAKGIVYLLVGWIALRSALGDGETTGSHGALEFLVAKPFGKVLLALLAVGLLGYAIWRFVQAVTDPEHEGTEPKGLAKRAYMVASGILHTALFVAAIRLVLGDSRGGEEGTSGWAARLMEQPAGRWLLGLVGVAVILAALQQLRLAYGNGYREHVRVDLLEPEVARWFGPLARLGLVSRSVVFTIIGGFLVAAAVHAQPGEAKGVGEALATLQRQPAGTALLLVVGLGLAAYGVYELVKARYRVIAVRDAGRGGSAGRAAPPVRTTGAARR